MLQLQQSLATRQHSHATAALGRLKAGRAPNKINKETQGLPKHDIQATSTETNKYKAVVQGYVQALGKREGALLLDRGHVFRSPKKEMTLNIYHVPV